MDVTTFELMPTTSEEPFSDAIKIVNEISKWLAETAVIQTSSGVNIDVITLMTFLVIVGFIIWALGNKEA